MVGLPAGWAATLPCEQYFAPSHGLQAPQPAAGFSKSRAILRGAPSRLELIRAQQAMGAATQENPLPAPDIIVPPHAMANVTKGMLPFFLNPAELPTLSLAAAADPIHLPVPFSGPAVLISGLKASFGALAAEESFGVQMTNPAEQRARSRLACMEPPIAPGPAEPRVAPALVRQGHPDIFGTVALSVSRTALDPKWRRATSTALAGRAGPWQALIARNSHLDRAAQVQSVNAWVNARIAYTEDRRQYGAADHWASAAESLVSGRGDCEDYAIAKMQLLRALGFASDSLYLVIARDLVRRADHAVLAVELDGELLVLDNETDQVLRSDEVRDYRPVLSFNGAKRWTHGYRPRPAMASLRMAAFAR